MNIKLDFLWTYPEAMSLSLYINEPLLAEIYGLCPSLRTKTLLYYLAITREQVLKSTATETT